MPRIIDISAFTIDGATVAEKLHVASQVLHSAEKEGYITITGHGVDDTLIDLSLQCSNRFFAQSDDAKRAASSKDRARRGFSPYGTENFASLLNVSGAPNDTVEKFRMGPLTTALEKESQPAYYGTKEGRLHFFPNTWDGTETPTENVNFQETLSAYYRAMEKLSLVLLGILELSLGLNRCNTHGDYTESSTSMFFGPKMDKHTSILTLNHYPPLGEAEIAALPQTTLAGSGGNARGVVRVADHTDVSMLTIVAQSPYPYRPNNGITAESCVKDHSSSHSEGDGSSNRSGSSCSTGGGLEMLDGVTNTWRPVPYIRGALVVNIGDCLQDWSGGRLKSTRHRVVTEVFKKKVGGDQAQAREAAEANADGVASEAAVASDGNETVNRASSSSNVGETGSRYSIAFFVSPNYDALLDWPVGKQASDSSEAGLAAISSASSAEIKLSAGGSDSCGGSSSSVGERDADGSSTGVSYSVWRKNRIAKAMKSR